MHLDEYGDPSEDQINDWNIHNDHQGDNEDYADFPECELFLPYGQSHELQDEIVTVVDICAHCEKEFEPRTCMEDLCDECQDEYDRKNPHPLDIAEREESENRSFGLEEPWWGR